MISHILSSGPERSAVLGRVRTVRTTFGRRSLAVVLAGVMVLGGGLVVFVAGSPAGVSAQVTTPDLLLESECRTGGYFQGAVSNTLADECEVLVRVHNAYVSNLDSLLAGGFGTGELRHSILSWSEPDARIDCGGSGCSMWEGVGVDGSSVTEPSIARLDLVSTNARLGLAGEISEELCALTRLTYLRFDGNFFSGEIPDCLGRLPNLRTLGLADNRLSGSIPATIAQSTTLNWFAAGGNSLTGVLPAGFSQAYYVSLSGNSLSGNLPADLGRADGYTVYLDLSDNEFDGAIPSAWTSRFTKINVFDLADNNLLGASGGNWINDWINAIEFVDTKAQQITLFSLEGNEICYSSPPALAGGQPRPFDAGGSFTGDYTDGEEALERPSGNGLPFGGGGKTARFLLGRQTCLSGQQYSNLFMPPVSNLQLSLEGPNVVVRWDPPAASSASVTESPTTYRGRLSFDLRLTDEIPNLLSGCPDNIITALQQAGQALQGGQALGAPFTLNGDLVEYTREFSILSIDLTTCPELLSLLLIDVTSTYSVMLPGIVTNTFAGDRFEPFVTGWKAYNVTAVGASRGASSIAQSLGVPADDSMYSWDAANQAWVEHPAVGDSGTLATGTAVMSQTGLTRDASLELAGLGRVDESIVLTLHQGWNLMAPELKDVDGDGAADDLDDRSQAATLFEGSLIDCDNLVGVLAIVAYDLQTEGFDLYLPCHLDVSAPGYGALDEIDRDHSLFIFFQSELPVPITWDTDSESYTPNV